MPLMGRGWAFIHVPKTGGTAIRHALSFLWVLPHSHSPASSVRDPMFRFGFARDPWDRLWSMYRFMLTSPKRNTFHDADHWRERGFVEWVLQGQHWHPWESKQLAPLQRRPQSWWLDGCDFVGRFERLQADFDAVCEHIGHPKRQLPKRNCAPAMGLAPWTRNARDAVAGWYVEDLQRWNYGSCNR